MEFYKLKKMVLEVIALINDMNKLIHDEDVIRDFTLVDKSSVPPMSLVPAIRVGFTSMKEVDCSKLVTGTESNDILNESDSSFLDDVIYLIVRRIR